MKRLFFILIQVLLFTGAVMSQSTKALVLEECYKLAKQNYPLVKQQELLAKSKEYSVSNASMGYLPQLSINGQATYQSEVTQIPIKLPGVNIVSPTKDQYKLYGEITEPITDLFVVKQNKQVQELNYSIQEKNLEAELYKIKDRVNQLFFGILLIDEQLKQTELYKKDIQTGLNKISVAITNGVELKSNENRLKAELLKADQRKTELSASRKAYTDMLGLFINQTLDESTKVEKPGQLTVSESINRPELLIFDSRVKSYDLQKKLITAKNLPRLALFFQGGIGQPNPVNMLSRDLSTYYIGGLRLNWNLTGFYTYKKEKLIIDNDKKMNDIQREAFLFNTNFVLKQQNGEITKLQELLRSDNEIVDLRISIKNTANTQLENGVISANDYIKEINAEDQARQSRLLHEVQLLMAQYNYQNTSGN